MKILLAIVGLVIVVVAAYLVYFTLVVNPRVVDELRTSPDGERARQVMLLTLQEGRTIPVNYLREGSKVFVGADGPWWRQFAGDGVTYDARDGFIDSPDIDPALEHGDPPAGDVFPLLR